MENRFDSMTPPTSTALPRSSRRLLGAIAVLAACAALFAGAYGVIRWSMGNGQAAGDPPQADKPSKHFAGWQKPDFVLAISGQMFGYTQPCGCSDPQYGGLARRWEFLESLRKKGWNVVPLDLGDLYPKRSDTPGQQNLLKYETAMRALHVMGYHAVGVGKQELGVPLSTALVHYSAQGNPRPRPVAANLDGVEEKGTYHELNVRPFEVVDVAGLPRIGIIGLVGKSVQDHVKDEPSVKFDPKLAPAALRDLAKRQTAFNVALFQTDEKFAPNAESELDKSVLWCQKQNQIPLHVVIHSCDDPEPPSIPRDLNGTQLITVGHKGRYVGVLGVWKNGAKYDYKYEMVLIGPEFEPKRDNPVSKLMQEYADKVKQQNLMAKFPFTTHPIQAELRNDHKIETQFAGSQSCRTCHREAHKKWQGTPHATATATLEHKASNPKLRQFDGECMQCHTTGFKNATGFNDPMAEAMKDKLNGVGCESCHGPASAHVKKPDNMAIRKLINPWAKRHNPGLPEQAWEQARKVRINTFCQSCHDIDNDVHWDFAKRWPVVEHMSP